MKSVYVASCVTLEIDPDSSVITRYLDTKTGAFASEGLALKWVREQRELPRTNRIGIRTQVQVHEIDADDLLEAEREYEVECEVKMTFYKTFTVEAGSSEEAERLAESESEDYDFSDENPDEFEFDVQSVEEV